MRRSPVPADGVSRDDRRRTAGRAERPHRGRPRRRWRPRPPRGDGTGGPWPAGPRGRDPETAPGPGRRAHEVGSRDHSSGTFWSCSRREARPRDRWTLTAPSEHPSRRATSETGKSSTWWSTTASCWRRGSDRTPRHRSRSAASAPEVSAGPGSSGRFRRNVRRATFIAVVVIHPATHGRSASRRHLSKSPTPLPVDTHGHAASAPSRTVRTGSEFRGKGPRDRLRPMGRDFLSVVDVTASELDYLLELAARTKVDPARYSTRLAGKAVAMVFEKPSTRTRVSFEVAVSSTGGHPVALSGGDLQLGRGETIEDTGRTLSRYVDAIVLRTFGQERLEFLAAAADIPVVNALSDFEHPCKCLADLLP